MRFENKLFFMLIIFNLISCNNDVDCNRDLVYEDGLTYYKSKLYTGDCNSFYENGNLMNEQSYLNGMDHGNWVFYYENGKVETEGNFIENKRNGRWMYYYDDGTTIRQISHYKLGEKDSIWVKYSFDGKIKEEYTY